MTMQRTVTSFFTGFSFLVGLVFLIFSFIFFDLAIVDWAIFLLVLGLVFIFFLGFVLLVPVD